MRRLASLAPLVALLAFPAGALADKEIVTCQTGDCFSPATVTMDQGERLTFRNADLVKRHDVQAKALAPDGKSPLFAAPVLDPGATAFVEGSQYLTTGSYEFVCTLHTGMEGTLVVSSAGTPQQRPAGGGQTTPGDSAAPGVSIAIARPSARRLARKRRIPAKVLVDEQADVTLTASVGSRRIGSAKATLFGGTRTDLSIRISKKNAKRLARGRKLTLKAVATDAAGNAGEASVTKTLR